MAKLATIGRLHRGEQIPKIRAFQKADDESVKVDNLSNLPVAVSAPPERKVRSRFKVSEPQSGVATYTISREELMATVAATMPVDRSADFARLAAQDAVDAMRDQALRRFGRRGPQRWRLGGRGSPVIHA